MPREIRRKTLCAWCGKAMRCKTRETIERPVCSCYMFKGRHPEPERVVGAYEGTAAIEVLPLDPTEVSP